MIAGWRVGSPDEPLTGRSAAFLALLLMRFFQNAALAVVPPILPRLSESMALSPTQAGAVVGAFGVVRLLTLLPLGLYLARVERAWLMVLAGVGLSLVGTVLMGLANGFSALVLGRAAIGLGHGMTYLSGQFLFVTFCPRSHVARLLNVSEAVALAALIIHGIVAGIIGDRIGWRAALAWAAMSVAVSALVVMPARKGMASGGWTAPLAAPEGGGSGRRIPAVAQPQVYALALVTAFTLSVAWTGILTTFIPLYGGGVLRLTSGQIAAVLSAAYLLDIAMLFPAGRLMDRRSRTVLLLPALGVLTVGVLLLPRATEFWTLLAASLFFVTGLVTWHVPATLVADVSSGSRQGLLLGAVRFMGDLALLVAPVLVGYLVQHHGYGSAALAASLFFGVNFLFAWRATWWPSRVRTGTV